MICIHLCGHMAGCSVEYSADDILTIHARDVHNTSITYITESKHPPMNHHEY